MKSIGMLTDAELNYLCEQIGGKEFRGLFTKDPKEFSKIKPGFRPGTLGEDAALKLAKENKKKEFILRFITWKTDNWLKEIKDYKKNAESAESDKESALVETLANSVFSDYPELYFKLSDDAEDNQYEENIDAKIAAHLQTVKTNTDLEEELKKYKEQAEKYAAAESEHRERVQSLEEQINRLKKEKEEEQIGFQNKIQSLDRENARLQEQLTAVSAHAKRGVFSNNAGDLDSPELLAQYDDTAPEQLPPDMSETIYSVCEIKADWEGKKWLYRYADIDRYGKLNIFHQDPYRNNYFDNRDKLYLGDGISDLGFTGVWCWTTVPNENDSTKDYVTTNFDRALEPIEVVEINGVSSVSALVSVMKKGIDLIPAGNRIMVSVRVAKDRYQGILLSKNNIQNTTGKVYLNESVIYVPVYEFDAYDLLHLKNDRTYLNTIFAGIPEIICQVKNPMEIVKGVVLGHISWSAFKERGLSKSKFQEAKKFYEDLPVDNIVVEISEACKCSHEESEFLWNQFKEHTNEYIDGNNFDNQVIVAAIQSNDQLMERAMRLVREDWLAQNSELVRDANAEMERIAVQRVIAEQKLEKAQKEYAEIENKKKVVFDEIAQKEKIAENVENAVSERIERAKGKVADFIADMAFVNGQNNVQVPTETGIIASACETKPSYTVMEETNDHTDMEAHKNWQEVIDTLTIELGDAGVTKNYSRSLATFLCAAYINRQPVLLVGPNSNDIIEAFSASLFAKKRGILKCDGTNMSEALEQVGNSGEQMVAVYDILTGNSMTALAQWASHREIFVIASHPFEEDVMSEPRSLFGYFMPLFTEPFIDNDATGKYIGGYFDKQFKPYDAKNKKIKECAMVNELSVSLYCKKKMLALMTVMQNMNNGLTFDDYFLCNIFSMAYATMSADEIREMVINGTNNETVSKSLIRGLKYYLGDMT